MNLTPEELAKAMMELTLERIKAIGIQLRIDTGVGKTADVDPMRLVYRNVKKDGRAQ